MPLNSHRTFCLIKLWPDDTKASNFGHIFDTFFVYHKKQDKQKIFREECSMKKKRFAVVTLALMLLVPAMAFASGYSSPAEIISELKGISVETVTAEKAEGKTYGEIAQENGVLDTFKEKMLEYKYSIIDQRVKDGVITSENGAAIKKAMKERVTACDGTPDPDRERLGQQFGGGLKFGNGQGKGSGMCQGIINGKGNGAGQGQCLRANCGVVNQ